MRSRVYYDSDVEGNLYPLWYTLEGSIDWNDPALFFFVSAPFERIDNIQFDDELIECSVFAQELIMNEYKVDLIRIMERLGHVDDDTTKKVYLHVTKTRKKEASQKFGNLMRNLNS